MTCRKEISVPAMYDVTWVESYSSGQMGVCIGLPVGLPLVGCDVVGVALGCEE